MGPTLGVGAEGARTSAAATVGTAWSAVGGGEEGLTLGM